MKRIVILLAAVVCCLWGFAQNTYYYNEYKHWSQELETLASEGTNSRAIVSLGSCYDRADGVKRDTNKALKMFKKAAELGDFLAYYNIGWYHYSGISTTTDYAKAEECFLKALEINPKMQPAYIGLYHIYDQGGHGMAVNYQKAYHMFTKASETGDYISLLKMAVYNEKGLLTGSPNYSEALKYYLRVKDQWLKNNASPAGLIANKIGEYYSYGKGVTPDLDKAIEHYKESVKLGFFDSYDGLAYAYNQKGLLTEAFEALVSAYEKGMMYVCNNIGDCYYYGRGTAQNFEKAYNYFEKGADTNPLCKYRQSEMLRNGEGVQQNVKMANQLLEEASDSGVDRAQYKFACFLYEGINFAQDYSKAIELFEKALTSQYMIDEAKGDICRKLSICYRFGRGVTASEQMADKYNNLAASYGDINAQKIESWLNYKH